MAWLRSLSVLSKRDESRWRLIVLDTAAGVSVASFHFSGLGLRQTNHHYLLGFDRFNDFSKPALFHYSQSMLPTNSYFQKMRDDGEAGPRKAREEEVRRYIRIKLKESFRVSSPQVLVRPKKCTIQGDLLGTNTNFRSSKAVCKSTRAQPSCKHRQPCGQPKVPDSGYNAPCYFPTPRDFIVD